MLQPRIDGIGFDPNRGSHSNVHPRLKNLTLYQCSARIGFANSGKSFRIVFQTSDKLIVM